MEYECTIFVLSTTVFVMTIIDVKKSYVTL